MTRIPAALAAALLALGAQAQTPDPAATAAAPAPAKPEKRYTIAEKSNLSISGRAWASFETVGADKGSVATATKVDASGRVSNNSSYLRFKGDIELIPGWKALAQIEAEFGIEGEAGLPFSGTRNTGVGLSSPYGQLLLGRWDSPSKQTTIGIDPFGGTGIFGYYNVFGQVMANGQGSNRFDRRYTNGLHYTSPNLYGVKILAAYAMGEVRESTVAAAGTAPAVTTKVNPQAFNVAAHYNRGPLYVGVAYEWRQDCNPDTNNEAGCSNALLGTAGTQPKGIDTAIRVGASYDIKQTWTKIALAYEHVDLTADALTTARGTAAQKTLQRDVYWGALTQGLMSDEHQLILAYGMATKASGQNVFTDLTGTDGSYFLAAYRFWFAKDTDLYAGYTTVMNGKNARYRIGSNNFGNIPLGATSTGIGAGIRYIF